MNINFRRRGIIKIVQASRHILSRILHDADNPHYIVGGLFRAYPFAGVEIVKLKRLTNRIFVGEPSTGKTFVDQRHAGISRAISYLKKTARAEPWLDGAEIIRAYDSISSGGKAPGSAQGTSGDGEIAE